MTTQTAHTAATDWRPVQDKRGDWRLATFKPQRFKAFSEGEKPHYFSCCECESEQIVAAAFVGPWAWLNIGVKRTDEGWFKLLLYCRDHVPRCQVA